MKFPRLGRLAKLIPQVEVSTQRREEFGKPPMRFFLSGRAFGVLELTLPKKAAAQRKRGAR